MKIRTITQIGLLSALIAILRYFFGAIPNVQPATALIIIMGIALGRKAGFIIGVLSTIISSVLMGCGTWVIFQIIGWGACWVAWWLFRQAKADKSLCISSSWWSYGNVIWLDN